MLTWIIIHQSLLTQSLEVRIYAGIWNALPYNQCGIASPRDCLFLVPQVVRLINSSLWTAHHLCDLLIHGPAQQHSVIDSSSPKRLVAQPALGLKIYRFFFTGPP